MTASFIAFALAFTMLFASGCAPLASQEPSAGITAADMTGRTLKLSAPAKRIVALTAADCEILYAIGAGELLVGRGEYCDYPEQALELPSVQSGYNTNIEQIIALKPDVVIMSKMAQPEEQIAQLTASGIQVAVTDAQDIQGVYAAIFLIGTLSGKNAEAEKLVSDMRQLFKNVSAPGGEAKKSVYFEVAPLEYGLRTAGKGTFMNEIAELLGLENCFSDVDGWAKISEEQVISRSPDYIVTITMYDGSGEPPEQEIASRPGWQSVKAVQTGAILNLRDNELSRPGPRLVDGAKLLYDFINQN